ncbi:spore germination protein [Aneurinibacillus sp. Ricciae_BoGa-3]|uniref:spore germination protein n=1 Tax=Aneurinibacillus sp. Ricciae_BoGa-3 TaxID=3022697 RepID=UPI0023425BEE|nr:spore germination protein [Aneurinibacillus sp. Ricciae_BoGa-3]WCK56536.1 spore germination protein [Aneurinibacillus sp. Ricciae_BoGa-3]
MYIPKKTTAELTLAWLKEKFSASVDVVFRELVDQDKKVTLAYIKSICDSKSVSDYVIKPFYEMNTVEAYEQYIHSQPNATVTDNKDKTLKDMLKGSAVLIINEKIYLLDFKNIVEKTPADAKVETTLQGPDKSISPDIYSSMNMIRHRYHKASLIIETTEVGEDTHTSIALLYDNEYADPKMVQDIKQKLKDLKVPAIQAAGELNIHLTKKRRSLFPTSMITERPDRIVLNLTQGKIVILINGTPFALVIPAIFFDFMTSMDDLYQPYFVTHFLKILRYIGLFASTMLPAMYVVIASYNPEILRVELALSIAASRAAVPYPSYLEVLFMMIPMELLVEASLRLPKTIGGAATTVGGLILGQAAAEAGLVSTLMIILVAAVAISNFVIPINMMGFSFRVIRYFLLFLTTLFGSIGLIIGSILLIAYLVHIDSMGMPFLKLFPTSKQAVGALSEDKP